MNLLHLLSFKGSRKVAFGIWLFIVANAYLWFKVIQSSDWMTCIALCTALIGGGTLGDKFLASKSSEPSKPS